MLRIGRCIYGRGSDNVGVGELEGDDGGGVAD